MTTYNRQAISFERGEGPWLWDSEGNRYLDAISGIAVCGLGHAHSAVTEAVCDQARKLVHTSNLYEIDIQAQAAERLTALAGMDAVFFGNSGAEANEAAIKLARLYGHNKGIKIPTIIVMENSFHGRTLATLTATGSRKVQAGFEPLLQGFTRAPYNDLQALENIAQNSNEIVAVMLEPIQGEGGVRIPDEGYLRAVRKLCNEHGWLMILDEIQTGMGRTGKWFCHQHESAVPDVMTLAKALGNGVPIGACLARGEAAKTFAPGNHGSTFGGNPLATRAALATLNAIAEDNYYANAKLQGEYMLRAFRDQLEGIEGVREVRGKGLMIGIELQRACGELVNAAREQGLLINVTADNVIRLLPPLIIDREQADMIIETTCAVVHNFIASEHAA